MHLLPQKAIPQTQHTKGACDPPGIDNYSGVIGGSHAIHRSDGQEVAVQKKADELLGKG